MKTIVPLTILLALVTLTQAGPDMRKKLCDKDAKPDQMENVEKDMKSQQTCLDKELPTMPPAREICMKSVFNQDGWPKTFADKKKWMCDMKGDDLKKFPDFMKCQVDEMKKKDDSFEPAKFHQAMMKCMLVKKMEMMKKMCEKDTKSDEMKEIQEHMEGQRKRMNCMKEKNSDVKKAMEECFDKSFSGTKIPASFDDIKKMFCLGDEAKNMEAMKKMAEVMKCQKDSIKPEEKEKMHKVMKECMGSS